MRQLAILVLAVTLHFSFFILNCSAQGVITTVAGSTWIFRGDGGPPINAPLGNIQGIAVDATGNVFAVDSDNHILVKISTTGVLTVVAGNGIAGFSGDGGPGTSASLNHPIDVAVDLAGNLYIADLLNFRIRKVSPGGTITTVVGDGQSRLSGDGGPAANASLRWPFGVVVDATGNLYIVEEESHSIRRVNPSGIITTVAGNGVAGFSGDNGPAISASLNRPTGVGVDAAGNFYIADTNNNRIRKVTPGGTIATVAGGGSLLGDGGPATAASLSLPDDVKVDGTGNLYIADRANDRIRKVSPSGMITTVAGTGVEGFSGDGGPATAAALFLPEGVAVDAAGNLYVADTGNLRIRKVDPAGKINTAAGNGLFKFAGDGGPATSASLNWPFGLALDATGNVYVSDRNNQRIRKITPLGVITTVAGNGLRGFSGDNGPAASASLYWPEGLAADASGNLYFADTWNHRIRKITPGGTITTAAGTGGSGFSGDGGPATSAMLFFPSGIAVDASGNLYIADRANARIRRVSPSGTINTVAGNGVRGFSGDGGPATSASLHDPNSAIVDGAGNLYLADTENHRVRKVTAAGVISTIAGNGVQGFAGDGKPATESSLCRPSGLALDSAGGLYIYDSCNYRIRRINSNGVITTVAGGGLTLGDGTLSTSAFLDLAACFPCFGGFALDGAGNLYISETLNDRIRKVLVAAPSFSVTPTSLSFSATAGSAGAASQQLRLSGSVAGLSWQATARTSRGGNWLSVSPASGQMPATVSITVDATTLPAGTYQGSVEISAPAATPSLITIAVTFTVTPAQPPSLSVQPSSFSFQVVGGASAPPAQSLRIENAGGGTLNWTAQAATVGGSWLAISPTGGAAPARLQVSANPSGLAAGSYAGSITVSSATTNQSVTVPVTLLISASTASLLLSQNSLLFRAVESGGAEPAQTFGVLNTGSGSMDWTAQATSPWLSATPASGRTDAGSAQIPQVNISVDPTGLAAGFYVGLVRVTAAAANNSPQIVRVDLHVLPAGTRLGNVVRPTALIFVASAGGSSPGSQEVRVATPEATPVEFLSLPIGGDWVTRAPDSGTATRSTAGRIVVQPVLGNLTAGIYRAGLSVFTKNDGEIHPVRLLFLVLPAGTTTASAQADGAEGSALLACTPSQLLIQFSSLFSSFNATVGWPTTALVNARDDCGNPAVGATVTLSFSSGDPELALADLKNGQFQGSWRPNNAGAQVVVTARASWRGLQGEATVTAQTGPNPNPQGNILAQGGVLLGAGFERGPVAPGSIISLFGQKLAPSELLASTLPLPKKLGVVRVLIGDKEAPLFYVGPGQVNAQVPVELAADRQLQVMVETNGVPSAPEPIQTAVNRPGIFTLGGTFGKQGAILIANTDRLAMPVTPNVPSEPVPLGGYISIYCTGLGPTDPPVASGEPGPATSAVKTPVTVTIGGQTASVTFAGLAPGFAGVYQVNAQVPAGVAPGNAVPVVLNQASFQSNTATIAVR